MNSPKIQIFVCKDPWGSYLESLIAQCDYDYEEYEHEQSIEDAETLQEREPDIFLAKAGVDPYWPPPELDRFEEIEPECSTELDQERALLDQSGCDYPEPNPLRL